MRFFWRRLAALGTGLLMLCGGTLSSEGAALAGGVDSSKIKYEWVDYDKGGALPEYKWSEADEKEETKEETKTLKDTGARWRWRWPSGYDWWIPAPPAAPASSGSSSSSSNTGVPTSEVIPVTAEVTESEANIRVKANASSSLLLRLRTGEELTILGQTTGADHRVWYRVRCENGVTGYVRYDRVDVICGTAQFGGSTEPTGRCVGQTNTRAVNVRLKMSTESSRIRLLRKGQSVTVICRARDAFGADWYYVRIPTGPLGYIHGSFLSIISGNAADAARPAAGVGQAGTGSYGYPDSQAGYGASGYPNSASGYGTSAYPDSAAGTGSYGYPDSQAGTGNYVYSDSQTGYGASGYGTSAYPNSQAGTGSYGYPDSQAGYGTSGYPNSAAGTGSYGYPDSQTGYGTSVYPNAQAGAGTQAAAAQAIPTPQPAAGASSSAQSQEEMLYLRYIVDHLSELNAVGEGYQGYSLQDLDGDGVQELLINCGVASGYGWRVFTCEGGTKVADLGRIEGRGYYAARPGGGLLILRETGARKTRYELVQKAGGILVKLFDLERTTDAAGNAVWTYQQKLVSTETLLALLADFTDETLLSLGIDPAARGGASAAPSAYDGQQYAPADAGTGEDYWTNPTLPGYETQQTDPAQPGPDDTVNG